MSSRRCRRRAESHRTRHSSWSSRRQATALRAGDRSSARVWEAVPQPSGHGECDAPPRLVVNNAERSRHFRVIGASQQELCAADDDGQRIVELMTRPGGEFTQGVKLLRATAACLHFQSDGETPRPRNGAAAPRPRSATCVAHDSHAAWVADCASRHSSSEDCRSLQRWTEARTRPRILSGRITVGGRGSVAESPGFRRRCSRPPRRCPRQREQPNQARSPGPR